MKKIVASLGVIALTAAGAANAGEPSAENLSTEGKYPAKEESIGMVGGFAIGAAAGGPVGAFVGLVLGAWIGDRMDTQQQTADLLAQRLTESDEALTAVSHKLAESDRSLAALTSRLTESQSRLAESERTVSLLRAPDGGTVTPIMQRTLRGEVMFRTNDSTVSADSAARLIEIAEVLATSPDARVQLDAYADPRGTRQENLALSEQRGEAVRAALIAGGLPSKRISVRPHGEHDASSAAGDVDGYALDRRVVLTIDTTRSTTQSTVAEVTD